ncbi:MAG: c-type cytochrome [Gammaproteobacteria bacterium]|jgi:cytochrome c553
MKNSLLQIFIAITLATLAMPLFADSVSGKTIAMQGNGKGATGCATCHGQQGEGKAGSGYPYLAGLPVEYVENQLKAYQNGTRKNVIMKPVAKALTAKEIKAVANYYAQLENPTLAKTSLNQPEKPTTGSRLVHTGKWEAGVPSCVKCHGENGKGVPPHFPPIVGQPAGYIKSQFTAWQKGNRSNDPIGLMQSVANGMTQEDINAVAEYLAKSEQ